MCSLFMCWALADVSLILNKHQEGKVEVRLQLLNAKCDWKMYNLSWLEINLSIYATRNTNTFHDHDDGNHNPHRSLFMPRASDAHTALLFAPSVQGADLWSTSSSWLHVAVILRVKHTIGGLSKQIVWLRWWAPPSYKALHTKPVFLLGTSHRRERKQ